MSEARFIVGDSLTVTRTLPDASVDLVLTSPPFLALRSYLPADHPDKGREIGSEATPAEFLQVLLELTAEWRRVLAPHGSVCVELGDTYSGAGGYGSASSPNPAYGAARFEERWEGRTAKRFKKKGDGWPLDKSLCGIPHLYHLSLAYGRNLLTGESSPAGEWRVRNVVAWCRPNPPVGALGDKFRPATSYMTVATMARTRYFDLDAVRGNPEDVKDQRVRTTNGPKQDADRAEVLTAGYSERVPSHPAGAPPNDHWWFDDTFDQDAWHIPTAPYKGSHYATWPPALLDRPILAMVPPKVCTTCGEPSRRITERSEDYAAARDAIAVPTTLVEVTDGVSGSRSVLSKAAGRDITSAENITVGWTDCGHDTWRRGVVLDPFAGSGTTLKVATAHGRDAIGIDLDERNADLAQQRVGMFLTVGAA